LLAERQQRGRLMGAPLGGLGLDAGARGQAAGDDRDAKNTSSSSRSAGRAMRKV